MVNVEKLESAFMIQVNRFMTPGLRNWKTCRFLP